MTTMSPVVNAVAGLPDVASAPPPDTMWRQILRTPRVLVGGGVLLAVVLVCIGTLPWTLRAKPGQAPLYDQQSGDLARAAPSLGKPLSWFGYDGLGRSILARCLLGGTISLAVGLAAALISVALGVTIGLIAGYRGGWIDSILMRSVDVLYALPYILLVVLFKVGFEGHLTTLLTKVAGKGDDRWFDPAQAANLVVLFSAIGLVSWLTMARVIRGQVLSLRSQPFIEACRAMGLPRTRIFLKHILPNLVGPITVYATLTVPSAILQESFLSFLGVGVNPPLPTWGSLASEGVSEMSPLQFYWWMLIFPCLLLVVTLLILNFLGDGLRDVFDPKREAAKI